MKRLPSLFRRPAFWLLVQPLALAIVMTAMGGMAPRIEPDTANYVETDLSSWRAAASGVRTLGYPLFLRAVKAFSPSFQAAPYLQFALHAAAVAALYAGLRRFGFSLAPALVAASTLLYSGFFLYYVPVLLPDAAALSLAVFAVACLAAVVGGGGAAPWVGFTAFVALAYHFRPAYLFLVPLAPLLGMAMWRLRPSGERRPGWLRLGGGLALVSAAPLLIFCGLRWATVGHFGLVSFGGYNVIGIAGQLLTPEVADEMPRHVQPLAHAILQKQRETPSWKPPTGYYDMYENYNPTIWEIVVPTARELYGEDDVVVNDRLGELSRGILLARPMPYIRWLLPAAKHGVTQLFEYSFLDRPGLTLLPLLALCQLVLFARWRQGESAAASTLGEPRFFFEYHATLLIALAFGGAKLLLVILVEPPIHRYLAPAAIFLPMWLAVAVVDRVGRLATTARRNGEQGASAP